jgi:hypothetical protein
MATDHNFRIKNGLEVGGVLIVNSSGVLQVSPATVSSNIKLNDNVKLQFGSDADSELYFDGSSTILRNTAASTGYPIYIQGGGGTGAPIYLQAVSGTNGIRVETSGKVALYYGTNERLQTTTSGVQVTGLFKADTGGSAQNALDIGGSSATNYTIQRWLTSAHSGNEAYLIAYGASHASEAGNFGIKNLEGDKEIFFELSGSAQPLRLTTTGASVTGNLSVSGDLNITGDINSVSVTDLDVVDKTITVGQGQSASNSTGSGLVVHGSNASMLWDNTDDRWEFNKDIHTSGSLEFGNGTNRIYKSGDSNSMHFDVPTALIGPSTTTASNPSLGTSSHRFDGVFSSTGSFSQSVTVGGDLTVADSNSNTDPTINFNGHTDTGLSVYDEGSTDRLNFITDGVSRGHANISGLWSFNSVYTSSTGSFRNYGGVWGGTTAQSGNGFYFLNTASGNTTKAMELSHDGNVIFAGTINSGAITSSGLLTLNDNYAMINAGTTSNTTLEPVIWARSKIGASVVQMNVQGDEWQFGGGGTLDTTPILKLKYGTNVATFAGTINSGAISSSGAITSEGNLLLDVDNAEINLKSGVGTTSGAINWTFNTTGTDYASIKLPYATRASTGLHIDSGYPITIDSASGTGIKFDVLGGNRATITNTGLSVSGTGSFTSNVDVATAGGSFTVGGDHGAEYWTKSYSVSNTNISALTNADGTSLATGGAYRFTGHIDGTGTDNSSRAVFWNENGTWYVNVTGQSGTASNHIQFLVSSGVPSVKTYHANNYTVRVWHERINLNENAGNDNSEHYFGADAYLSKIGNDLSVNANILKIAATGTAPASAKLHIGAINSASSSAIAQFGGFIRASNYLILHDGAGSTNTVQMRNTAGDIDLTQGEGTSATPATRVHTLKISGTTVIDNSGNLSNIGTINSGAISSSGAIVGSTVQATGNLFGTTGLHTLNTAGDGWDHTINRNGGNPTANLPGGITSGSITSTGNSVFTGGNSDGTGNAFEIKRGGNSQQQAFRVQNTGEVVIGNNYLYAAGGGTSFYSQGDAVFRANIRNDSNGGADPVKVSDALNITGNIQSNGTVILESSGRNLTNIGTISSGAATLTSGNRVLTLLTASQSVTDDNVGFTIREKDSYSDGRYEHRFRKRDEGGGIPLYIDKTESTAGSHTQIARFGSYSSNPEEFQVYGKAKVTDLNIHSGTSGTNTQGLLFTNTDNTDVQAYIKKSAYYMHYNSNQNEGHHFTYSGTGSLLRLHGSNNGTRPNSVDITAANGLYVNNTQVINSGRAITAENVLNVNSPDGGSSPAMTATINLKGYEGRGTGIKIRDSVNSASSPSNREWFIGSGYGQSGFNIGYAADGSQSSYYTQNKFSISTDGHASFAGNITAAGTLNATDLTLSGNLVVNGTTTTLNTATLNVEDKNIILNYGSGDTSSTADYAGITIQDAVNSSTNATINWHQSGTFFNFSHNVNTDGWLQHTSYLYSRNDLKVLNASNNGWNDWATRNNGTFDLSVGAITTNNSVLISYSSNDGANRDAGLKIMNDGSDWGAYIRKASGAAYGLRIDSSNDHAISVYTSEGGSTRSFYVHGGTGLISTSSHGTSANWKQAYDNYITGIGVSGTSTKTITLTQRDGGTISANFTDLQGSAADGVVDSLAFDAGTVAGGTSGTGVLTLGRSGSLSDLTVDLDGRYLQRQYMNNWTRVGYGNSGATVWHKLCTVTITGSYQDYNVGFFWTDRYDRGEASIHVHSDNDTTADVWGARFVSTTSNNRKAASDVMYTASGSTVEIFVRTPGWREFDYIRNDAVTEGTPSITWYDESTTTEYSSQPSNVTAFTDMTPISQNGYNNSFNGNLADKDNSTYYLNPAGTSNLYNVSIDRGNSGDDAFIELKNTGYTGNITSLRQNADSTRAELNSTERSILIQAGSGGGSTGAEVRLYANQTEGIRVVNGGKVGIGISTTPQRRLTVVDGSAGGAGDNSGILSLTVGNGSNTDSKMAFGIDSSHNGWIHVVKPGNNVMNLVLNPTASSNGKVGIGKTPDAMLDIAQNMTNGSTSGITSPHLKLTALNTVDTTGFVGMSFATSSSANYGWSYGALRQSNGTGDMTWRFHNASASGNEKMRLTEEGYLGIGTQTPDFLVHINRGTSGYAPSSGVTENLFGINTSYNAAGVQGVYFSNLDGNWIDGTSGGNTAYGWLWGYENLVRGGLVYDHRGSERMQLFSSYGALAFITPDAADGNGVPTDANMVERLTILPGGNVGIGTTSPGKKLEVAGVGNTDGIRITGGSANVSLIINNTGSNGVAWDISSTGSGHSYGEGALHFGVGFGLPKMKITSDGKVGIGTNAPGAKLQVSINDGTNYASSEASELAPVGTDALYLFNEETSSTYGKTSILMRSAGSGGGAAARITLKNERSGAGSLRFLFRDSAHTTEQQEKMVIKSSGNVGIGTSNPGVELDIKRTANATPLRIGSSQGEGRAIVFADIHASPTKYNWITGSQYNVDNSFEITPSTATGGYTFNNPSMVFKQDGQVLINKTGSDVGASTNIVEADGNFRLSGGNRTIKFNNGSHEILGVAQIASNKMQYGSGKLTIDVGNSSVGIGTASPQQKLDAVGTIRSTHNIVSNTVYKAFSIGSNRTINDYGGLNKDYWAIQLATPGASTDGQSSGHAYGALKFSGVSGADTTLDDVLVLNYNGNVGIGTSDPAATLDVAGDALIQTALTVRDNITVGNYSTTDTGSLLLTGSTANKQAVLKCTNGNLHMDGNSGNSIYLNYYTGTSVHFGSGAGSAVAVMGPDGDLWKGSSDNNGDRYFNDGYHPNADKWTTARTLTLSGDVTGSVSFDGSGAINMTNTAVANDSHTHDGRYFTETESDSRYWRRNETGSTADFGPWYNTTSYVYDATNSTRYYWNLLGTIASSGCRGTIEYEAKDDENYPNFVKGTIAFGGFSGGTSFSVQHDQHTQDPFGVQVRLDTSRRIWIRVPNCDWSHYFRFRVHNQSSNFTTNTSWSTGSTRYDTHTTAVPPNSSNDILSGQNLRATSSSVTGTVPSYENYNRFGRVHARQDILVDGPVYIENHIIHTGDTDTYTSFPAADEWNLYCGGARMIKAVESASNHDYISFFDGTSLSGAIYFDAAGNGHFDANITAYSTTTGSDKKLKENIRPLENSLDKVLSLDGVMFDWKKESRGKDQIGFIAQQVEEHVPELVGTMNDIDIGEAKTVNYEGVVPMLVEAIKDLKAEIDDLKEQLKNK